MPAPSHIGTVEQRRSTPAGLALPRFATTDARRGLYESFFVRGTSPDASRAFWLRHTVHRRPGEDATASLWLTLFGTDGVRAGKQTVGRAQAPPGGGLVIADATLAASSAAGSLRSPTLDAGWSIAFAGPEPAQPHLPAGWLYRSRLPRTKSATLRPGVELSGTVAGERVDGWRGLVSHNWGSEHAHRWVWIHALLDGGWIELVAARIRVAGAITPWIVGGAISIEGRRQRLGGLGRIRQVAIDARATSAEFAVPAGDMHVRGRIGAPPERFVCWRYADPGGGEHHCAHTSLADLELAVTRPRGRVETLPAWGAGAYELGMTETDHGLTVQPYADGVVDSAPPEE